jgi:L-aminopeptidase/D-esterase-like protein
LKAFFHKEQNHMHDDITDVPGIQVGQYTDLAAGTGCTVVISTGNPPATGGVDVRGGAPATRETDLLSPLCMVNEVHAVLLTGGSAFGLDAASGVVKYLEQQHRGFDTGVARVPIVPAAALFDLPFGSAQVRPDATAGYQACEQANDGPVAQGNVGAGTGATVGKMFGPERAMKGGLGSASMTLAGGIVVGAIVAVNALGDIVDPQTQQVIAGARHAFALSEQQQDPTQPEQPHLNNPFGNTTIAVIATNAILTKAETNKVAQMAHDGLARVIRPAHTMFDGDTIFALSTGIQSTRPDPATTAQRISAIGAAAADTLARAIIKAVRTAQDLHGIPAARS